MTYEARPNKTHALKCDTGVCSNELLAPTQDELFEDANLCGWIEGNGKHACPDCTRGANLFKTVAKAVFGTDSPTMTAPANVRAGDPVFDEDGKQVASYKSAAKMGELVPVELYVPVQTKVAVSDRYAEILGRAPSAPSNPAGSSQPDPLFDAFDEPVPQSDAALAEQAAATGLKVGAKVPEDKLDKVSEAKAPEARFLDDLFGADRAPKGTAKAPNPQGRVNPPTPLKGVPRAPQKRGLDSPAGTAGGAGLVKVAPPIDPNAVEQAKRAVQVQKNRVHVKIEKIEEAADMFSFLDQAEKTRWSPDGK